MVEALNGSGLVQAGGVCTSSYNSTQQWDLPNAWAPMQLMVIEGLNASALPAARYVAIANRQQRL